MITIMSSVSLCVSVQQLHHIYDDVTTVFNNNLNLVFFLLDKFAYLQE